LRLILVSNRVAIPTESGAHRAGGLEVVLAPTLKRYEGVWFGWSGNVVPGNQVTTKTIERFANRVLWPILHYRIDLAEFTRRDLTGYLRVNRHFADELSKVILPSDLIWVHDYHFIPLGEELRKRRHHNRIGFFLHVPFPAPEFITVLPRHERFLSSLLQYDLVGFQTEGDVRNFVRYALSENRGSNVRTLPATDRQIVLNQEGRNIRVGSFPVGIDPADSNDLRVARPNRHSFGKSYRVLGGEHCLLALTGLTTPKASSNVWKRSTYFFLGTQIGAARSRISRSHPRADLRSRSTLSWKRRLGRARVVSTGSSAKHHGHQSATLIAPIAGQPWPVSTARLALASLHRCATA
jgi:trehalose-6-phosphate synthase